GSLLYELDVQDLAAVRTSPLAFQIAKASAEKEIPEIVWRAPLALKRVFLQSLFEGDGSSSLLPRNSIQISYSTYSDSLARGVQQLLLEFGVVARLCRYAKGEIKVVIGNRRDARLFAAHVGFFGAKQRKLEVALASLPVAPSTRSRDFVPYLTDYVRSESDSGWLRRHNIDRTERWERGGTAILERIESEEVRSVVEPLVSADYFYAEVESVTLGGVQPVYSLRVETDDNSFVTNGFVSHNTECRLSRMATELLRDIDADTVDFEPNYVRGRAHIEQLRGGKSAIIITELPYGVRKAGEGGVIEKIADLVKAGTLTEVPMSDDALQDHSDKEGMRIYVELKREAVPQVALNKLFKLTPLQTTFGYNAVALVDGVPKTLSLLELIRHYLVYQREVVTRRSKYELRQAEKRAHVLEGYLKALDSLDAVIALIRAAADTDAARTGLMRDFELSEIQAQAILDLRLARLTKLAREEIQAEFNDLQERIAELRTIVGD